MHIPNLDNTTILIIVGAVVILVVLLMMGSRLRRFIFKAGGINASADSGAPGAKIGRTTITGDNHEVSATGSNATVDKDKLKGRGSTAFGIGKDDDP